MFSLSSSLPVSVAPPGGGRGPAAPPGGVCGTAPSDALEPRLLSERNFSNAGISSSGMKETISVGSKKNTSQKENQKLKKRIKQNRKEKGIKIA